MVAAAPAATAPQTPRDAAATSGPLTPHSGRIHGGQPRAPNPALLFDVLAEDDDGKRAEKLLRASIDLAPGSLSAAPRASNGSGSGPLPGYRRRPPDWAGDGGGSASNDGAGAASSNGGRPSVESDAVAAAATAAAATAAATVTTNGCNGSAHAKGGSIATNGCNGSAHTNGTATDNAAAADDADDGGGWAGVVATAGGMAPAEVLQELLGPLYVDASALTMGELLGQGGFAEVRRATLRDTALLHGAFEEPVAVKTLRADALRSPVELREFLAEANLLRKMAHPHIVRLRGVGARDLADLVAMRESMIVVQELMAGGDLKALVSAAMARPFDPPYTRADALRWAMQVAEAMQYLHGVCRPMVIHRDLKLDNVLLTGGPSHEAVAKIADFGLHKRVRAILKSGLALPWAADVQLVGDACEKSYYGGSMYLAALAQPSSGGGGTGGGGGMVRSGSVSALARVHEEEGGGPAGNGGMRRVPSAAEMLASGDIATRVLSSAGVGDASRSGRSASARRGGLAGARAGSVSAGGGAGANGDDASVHRRLAAVQALEGSVRAGSAFFANGNGGAAAVPPCGSAGSSRRGGGGGDGAARAASEITPAGAALAQLGASQHGVAIDATQKVGSLIYMAPEVLAGSAYSEKVDVFSFGVLLYELLTGTLLASKIAMAACDGDPACADLPAGGPPGGEGNSGDAGAPGAEEGPLAAYARRVSQGHREELPAFWPKQLKALVAACWAQDPAARPSFARVLEQLHALRREGVGELLDALRPRPGYNPTTDCGCACAIM